MEIRCMSYSEMSSKAASLIEDQLVRKPNSNFGLAWGSSPLGTYELLSNIGRPNNYSWQKAKVFAGDEYLEHSIGSELLAHSLYDHIDLPELSHFSPIQVDKYDLLITDSGGLDLLLLGFGRNGHLMACEPGTPWSKRTHIAKLATETVVDNQRKYGEEWRFARTIGPATIMEATRIVLFISGENKREAALQALYGPLSEQVTGSILQRHRHVTVLCDFSLNPVGNSLECESLV